MTTFGKRNPCFFNKIYLNLEFLGKQVFFYFKMASTVEQQIIVKTYINYSNELRSTLNTHLNKNITGLH